LTDQSRTLPSQPNLRYLKLEAKRRLAAGEFETLHDAQLAIAREHGLPSWAKLKERIAAATASEDNPALRQVRWVLARFAGAGGQDWAAPDGDELSEHFDERFLHMFPPGQLVSTITRVADQLSAGELTVATLTPTGIRARIADLQVEAVAEEAPPHRLTGLRAYPIGGRVSDPRAADPADVTAGDVPAQAVTLARDSLAELGLPGLVLAGTAAGDAGAGPASGTAHGGGPAAGRAGAVWAVARGWADLERGEALHPGHRFPAYSVTKAVTAVTVLLLVADGQVALDRPANDYLRTVRLASDAVTVRELLSHTGGVDSPAGLFADTVPSLLDLTGPVLPCGGQRGKFSYSNGGYAALGQLIADVTGSPYPAVVASRVLRPLAMHDSSFPESWPGSDAVTPYRLGSEGSFEAAPAQVVTVPAAGGLFATAADLVRFGQGWRTLLPPSLASESLRPQATREAPGAEIGLGWLLHQPTGLYGHAGGGESGASSLLIRPSDGCVCVTLTSRLIPVESVGIRLIHPLEPATQAG
jgi:CubicO group peptidase (beta-lactamase class C family)